MLSIHNKAHHAIKKAPYWALFIGRFYVRGDYAGRDRVVRPNIVCITPTTWQL